MVWKRKLKRDYEHFLPESWTGLKVTAYKVTSCFEIEKRNNNIVPKKLGLTRKLIKRKPNFVQGYPKLSEIRY